uniref:SCO7613 C-terminal domain-containing membrane protein n=1 Tax=Pseudolysinimonas sp. TaxID=2680009 RepID=UPI003782E453
DAALALRAPLLVAAHVILVYLAAISWADERLTVAAGAAIILALGVLAMAMPLRSRPAYVAVGYGYALVLVARGLDLLGLDTIPVIASTATVASVAALVVTLVRRVRAPLWYAVLGVTAVPFLVGVATVIAERTWETALANAAIFALCLTLTLTRRPGLTRFVRSGAAALLLPSLAVVFVNVVPRIIETDVVPAWNGQGGAPVTLPLIATLVALVLPTSPLIAASLRRGEVPEADAASVRRWIEISAFVTGAITALLALVLTTADLSTALLVFLILGIGAAGAAVFAHRRYGWWVAAGSWTAALWCVWGLVGITDVEPYVYPPALAAVVIGVVLSLRGRTGAALVAPGLAIAIATSLVVLAVSGSGEGAALPWRALALLAASLMLLVLGVALARRVEKLAGLRVPLLAAAIGAAGAGAIQAVRYAWELDDAALGERDLVVWPVLVFSVVAAILAGDAARHLRPTHRWLLTPALAFLIAGPIATVSPGAGEVAGPPIGPMWMLWALMLVLLGGMLGTVVRSLRGTTILPPIGIVFVAAWFVAVAGWSVRALNVEWFSLPLGLALTAAGVLVLRHGSDSRRGTLTSWPVGFTRSWAVLAPGIVVTVLPSVLATGTNPATWRAILVLGLALVALLVGALLRYAAPFVLSLATFGVEILVILVVLAVGRDIDPVIFYVAAGSAGVILITVAIWFERRSRGDREGSARMRDLR